MSIETAPSSHTSLDEKPEESEVDASTIDSPIESERLGALATPEAAPAPQTAESRVSRFLRNRAESTVNGGIRLSDRIDNVSQAIGVGLESAADRYQSFVENGRERFTTAKDALRGFGRAALTLPRRTYLEARVQLNVGREVASDARDAVVDKATEIKDSVVDKATEIKTNVQNRVETTKQAFNSEIERAMNDLESLVNDTTASVKSGIETGLKMADQLAEGIDAQIIEWKAQYNAARDQLGDNLNEKLARMNTYFAARKNAALERKQARADARAKRREVNQRVVNIETQNRLEQREKRLQDREFKRIAGRIAAEEYRTALTALRNGQETSYTSSQNSPDKVTASER